MTQTRQHQEPIKHAEEHVESVVLASMRAEAMLSDALESADPKLIQASQARLNTAQHDETEARKHFTEYYENEHYRQQLEHTSDELHQAKEVIEEAQKDAYMPKQVR